jgi:DNA-binding MarR family transcriptional regulator
VTTNGASEPAGELVDALVAAGRVMVAMTARSLARLDADLTLPQYRMLVVLAARGPQRTTDLAGALGVTPSTVTRTCDRLVRRGLAQRFQRSTDRRASWIALTESGKVLIGTVMRERRADVLRLARLANLSAAGPVTAVLDALVAAAGEPPEGEWWRRWEVSSAIDGPVRL